MNQSANPIIRHRRLHAFFRSKILNSMMIVIILSLLLMAYTRSMYLPIICGTIALLLFIGYSLWLWIKKPNEIIINNFLSDVNSLLTFYYIIVSLITDVNPIWYILPIAVSVVALFISMVLPKDKIFVINRNDS